MLKAIIFISMLVMMVGNAMADNPKVIYEKNLTDGNVVIVEKLVRNEHIPIEEVELSKEALEQLGERWGGGRTVRGGDYRIYDLSLKIKGEQGKENIVWQKELRALLVPHRDPDAYYMAVYDVEEKDHELAIVYVFEYSIILEVLRKDDQDVYQVIIDESLYRGGDIRGLSSVKLVWLDNLFVLNGFKRDGTDIWRVDTENKVVERIFTQRRIWQAEE